MCVLKWLKSHKYITTADAFNELYILDLQGRIRDLKEDGYCVGFKWKHKRNIYGVPVKYKMYYLIKKGE